MATPKQLIAGLSGYISYEEQSDLGPIEVTIKSSQVETVGQGDKAEDKPVLRFNETRKALVLNKTRLNQLKEIVGCDNEPEGTRVRLEAEPVNVNGRTFNMVVIKPTV